MIEFKKKIEKCCYSHISFKKPETGECCRYCVKDGWDDDKIKDITEDICENCPNYKSRFIEYPITVSGIVTEGIKYNDSWQYKIGTLCAIRPCAEEYEGKTYLGIYLGDLPISHHITHDPKTKILKVGTMDNPAIFVPDLNKIIFGCASWWHKIENIDEIKDITKEDIENTWYVKLIKKLENE